jgi:hypothetical protein
VGESLPLAEKPHLLQPNVRKDELFGIPKSSENSSLMEIKANQLGLTSRHDGPPSYAPLLAKRPRTIEKVKVEEVLETEAPKKESITKLGETAEAVTKPEEMEISVEDTATVAVAQPITPALTKPPPLVKITPPENSTSVVSTVGSSSSSSTTTTVLSIPKWGSPQSAPQDLSITGRTEEPEVVSPNAQRAPIIVSAKRLSPIPSSALSRTSSDLPLGAGRPVVKSVIVCHRQNTPGNVKLYS